MADTNGRARDLTHTMLAVLFIGILIAGSFWVIRPFLMPLLWAAVIVVATWPSFERLEVRLGGRHGLAVAIMAAAILLVIIVPITLAVVTIAGNLGDLSGQIRALSTLTLSSPPEWVGSIPLVGGKLAASWQQFAALDPDERTAALVPYAKRVAQWLMARAGGFGVTMLSFLLTVVIAAILYANGAAVRAGIFAFARRLAGERGEAVATLAGKAIRGVVLGVVVTALIQAGLGGAGLVLVGIPAAGLLAAVMLMLCLAQLGPLLVLLPAVAWVYWSGRPAAGTILLVIALVAGTLDNVVRPFLIKKGADLPLLLIFSGVIGGLVAFGVIGLFIGPMVLAVTYTLLEQWVKGDAPETGGAQAATSAETA
jgi:predicted PurR-regulated permease PerM